MNSAAAHRELFMPQPPGGLGHGLVLALLVHAMLVAALAVGVNWRSSNPQGMQAELWAAVPQVASPRAAAPEERAVQPPERPSPSPAPPPPQRAAPVERTSPPPPALPDPKIAIAQERLKNEAARKLELAERADKADKADKARRAEAELAEKRRREQALQAQRAQERELAEQRARQKALDAKAEQAAKVEAQRLADAREAAIRRMTAQAGGSTGEPGATGSAAQTAAPSAGYTGRVIARIKPNIVFVDTLTGNPEAEVLVRLAPDGRIISQKLVRSSGSREWDQAVQRAIERTEILPRDTDGRVPSSMSITFRPRE